jgi:hypothetical protein
VGRHKISRAVEEGAANEAVMLCVTPKIERPWLEEKVYALKRTRTLDLVRGSVDKLKEEGIPVSLESIRQRSKELDPNGKGISHSSILNNTEARSYYEQHRAWKGVKSVELLNENSQGIRTDEFRLPRIKSDRDIAHLKRRYMNMSKRELVKRLIKLEQCYAAQGDSLMAANEEILLLRIQADSGKIS